MKRRARFCLQCGGRMRAVRAGRRVRRRCPRCGFTFYDNPVLASCAVVTRRGRVLLARRAHPPYVGLWDFPGGFLEAGETPERALRRELREELGVKVRRWFLLDAIPFRQIPFPSMRRTLRKVVASTRKSLRVRGRSSRL